MYLFLLERVCACPALLASSSAFLFSPWPFGWGELSEATLEVMLPDTQSRDHTNTVVVE